MNHINTIKIELGYDVDTNILHIKSISVTA